MARDLQSPSVERDWRRDRVAADRAMAIVEATRRPVAQLAAAGDVSSRLLDHTAASVRAGGRAGAWQAVAFATSAPASLALRRSRDGDRGPASVSERERSALGPGEPLSSAQREALAGRLEAAGLDVDLTRVRVHQGAAAAALCAARGANALTIGDHIVFASGVYEPATRAGLELVLHELTHVAQGQAGLVPGAGAPAPAVASLEAQADRVASAHADPTAPATEIAAPESVAGPALADISRQPLADPGPAAAAEPAQYSTATVDYAASLRERVLAAAEQRGVPPMAILAAIADEKDAYGSEDAIIDSIIASMPHWQIAIDRAVGISDESFPSVLSRSTRHVGSKLFNAMQHDLGPGNIKLETATQLVESGELTVPGSPADDVDYHAIAQFLLTDDGTVQAAAAVIAEGQARFGEAVLSQLPPEQAEAVLMEYYKQGPSYYDRFRAAHDADPTHLPSPGSDGQQYLANRGRLLQAMGLEGNGAGGVSQGAGPTGSEATQAPAAPAVQRTEAPAPTPGGQRATAARDVIASLKANGATYDFGNRDYDDLTKSDCSKAVQLMLEAAGQGDVFGRSASTETMVKAIRATGGDNAFHKTDPKAGDLALWGHYVSDAWKGHVAMVVGVDATNVQLANMGVKSRASIITAPLGAEMEASLAPYAGNKPFLGFWTPPDPVVAPGAAPPAPSTSGGAQPQLARAPSRRAETEDASAVHAIARRGVASGAQLPYLDVIQRAFGRHDVSGVRAAVGGAARQASRKLGARAYAYGDAIAFGDTPDLHTAAHEAAHVVQQRAGIQLEGPTGRAGDRYEQQADAIADRVVAGKSAEGVLGSPLSGGATRAAVQRVGEVATQHPPRADTAVATQRHLRTTAVCTAYRFRAGTVRPAGTFEAVAGFDIPAREIVTEATHADLGVSRSSQPVATPTGEAGASVEMVYVRMMGGLFAFIPVSQVVDLGEGAEASAQTTATTLDVNRGTLYRTTAVATLHDRSAEGAFTARVPTATVAAGVLVTETEAAPPGSTHRQINGPGNRSGWVLSTVLGAPPATEAVSASANWRAGYTARGAVITMLNDNGTAQPNSWVAALTGAAEVLLGGATGTPPVAAPAARVVAGRTYWFVRQVGSHHCGWVLSTSVRAGVTQTDSTDDVAGRVREMFPTGITVAFYAHYDVERSGDLREFHEEAVLFAQRYHAVGIAGGRLALGHPIPVASYTEIPTRLREIKTAITGTATETPLHARVQTFALFAHGWATGMGTSDSGTSAENLSNNNVGAFSANLAAFLTNDAEVALYACSTGGSNGDTGGQPGAETAGARGEDSFSDRMQEGLTDAGASQASVLGHTTARHTAENRDSRLFGPRTGGQGGIHAFNYVFPQAWIDALHTEILAVAGATVTPTALRAQLWALYDARFAQDDGARAGREVGLDPAAVRTEMRLLCREKYGLFTDGTSLVTSAAAPVYTWSGSAFAVDPARTLAAAQAVTAATSPLGTVSRSAGGRLYTHVTAPGGAAWVRTTSLAHP